MVSDEWKVSDVKNPPLTLPSLTEASETPVSTGTSQPQKPAIDPITELARTGTKEEWKEFLAKTDPKTPIRLPPIDEKNPLFPLFSGDNGYGYRALIYLLAEDRAALESISTARESFGALDVKLNKNIKGDDVIRRGLEAYCDILYNGNATYNPVLSTEYKYLEMFLGVLGTPEREGDKKKWNVGKGYIIGYYDKENIEWVYEYKRESRKRK